jgi:hypothetical protein
LSVSLDRRHSRHRVFSHRPHFSGITIVEFSPSIIFLVKAEDSRPFGLQLCGKKNFLLDIVASPEGDELFFVVRCNGRKGERLTLGMMYLGGEALNAPVERGTLDLGTVDPADKPYVRSDTTIALGHAHKIVVVGTRQRGDHTFRVFRYAVDGSSPTSLTRLYVVNSDLSSRSSLIEFRHLCVYFDRVLVVTCDAESFHHYLTFFDLRTGVSLGQNRLPAGLLAKDGLVSQMCHMSATEVFLAFKRNDEGHEFYLLKYA